jgi:hypothetical protein
MKPLILITSCIAFLTVCYTSCTYKKQTNCSPANVITYKNTVGAIIDAECVGCHGGNNPSANINLENYAKLVAYAKDKPVFMGCINHTIGTPMPYPAGSPKLNDTVIAKIQAWVDGCMPE